MPQGVWAPEKREAFEEIMRETEERELEFLAIARRQRFSIRLLLFLGCALGFVLGFVARGYV